MAEYPDWKMYSSDLGEYYNKVKVCHDKINEEFNDYHSMMMSSELMHKSSLNQCELGFDASRMEQQSYVLDNESSRLINNTSRLVNESKDIEMSSTKDGGMSFTKDGGM